MDIRKALDLIAEAVIESNPMLSKCRYIGIESTNKPSHYIDDWQRLGSIKMPDNDLKQLGKNYLVDYTLFQHDLTTMVFVRG